MVAYARLNHRVSDGSVGWERLLCLSDKRAQYGQFVQDLFGNCWLIAIRGSKGQI